MDTEEHVAVVGYASAEASRDALQYAVDHGATRLLVVHVVNPSSRWANAGVGLSGPSSTAAAENQRKGEAALADLPPVEAGVEIERIVGEGNAAGVLTAVARERGADMIVVGRPRRRAHVVGQLVRDADRPVVVVPPR